MAKRSFTRYIEQELGRFPHFIVYALLEWVLIMILFIDGFLAFFANEFARFFELQLPCLLCTRIDHFLIHRNSDFYYNDSMCESHKKDVSSLAYCHNHNKLSDIRKMCEACLLSFATQKESDCDTYKSLVGILHKDLECFVKDDYHQIQLSLPSVRTKEDNYIITNQFGEKIINTTNLCSCCGEPLKVKSSYANNKGTRSTLFSQAPTPSPRTSLPTPTKSNIENRGLNLPHIRYSDLKFNDNDSELLDEEYGSNAINSHLSRLKEEVKAGSEGEDLNEDSNRTPNFIRGNRFFGIPLTDSAQNSPKYYGIKITRKSTNDKTETDYSSIVNEGGGLILNEAADNSDSSILNHLKRQVRLDRKSLIDLYMELDEERSASAVAANNAMAMITRLQAEKAAVQMEALQYQRMMEEQAEYDQEALQATNDMLVKREEDIRVLEAELQVYRQKYGELEEQVHNNKTCQSRIDEDGQEFQSLHYSSYNDQSVDSPFNYINQDHQETNSIIESTNDLKEDNIYLLGQIKNFEKKTDHLTDDGDHHLLHIINSDYVNNTIMSHKIGKEN